MSSRATQVLLVEDNPGDAVMVETLLKEVEADAFELTHAAKLDQAVAALQTGGFDIVLLDLKLPQSDGLETYRRLRAADGDIPVVVLTGMADEAQGPEAVRAGAQDYLGKDGLTSRDLWRALQFALARHEAARRQLQMLADELHDFERARSSGTLPVTAAAYAAGPLRETHPERFADFKHRYAEALAEVFQQQEGNATTVLKELAAELGVLKASARDVADLHVAVLGEMARRIARERLSAYVHEGRIVAFELTGHLLNYYRRLALAAQPRLFESAGEAGRAG